MGPGLWLKREICRNVSDLLNLVLRIHGHDVAHVCRLWFGISRLRRGFGYRLVGGRVIVLKT